MIGATLKNRYRIDAEIGRGGMGTVYRGHDTLLKRAVAIKAVSPTGLDTTGRARLIAEAQAAAQLDHPHIVTVYDVIEETGAPYIIEQLVTGETLQSVPPTQTEEILALAAQICAALAHAHARGVIHRDIKPANVILTNDGQAKLMDFGLASLAARGSLQEGALQGTIHYMPPEQALGNPPDARSDLYSLGVMLYEWTTGQLPFQADQPIAVIQQHLHETPRPPRAVDPSIPPELETIILQLLAKNPADRHPDAEAVAAALRALSGAPQPPEPSPTPRHNLPAEVTDFIGRAAEVNTVQNLLDHARTVTLTGAGGCGKTRLALRAAQARVPRHPEGVWWVELGSLDDPELVPQRVAAVFDLREAGDKDLLAILQDHLCEKQLLLVLDNCEHLIEACAQFVGQLLSSCPGVAVLATSREALGVDGERVFRVPSLSIPPGNGPALLENWRSYEALQLFASRAEAALPDFTITAQNVEDVAGICNQLDGIPLAIELAAARVKVLNVAQIRTRLNDRFRLLTSGRRTALPRHQTLRAMIDWSYGLLDESERVLFERLSVFSGGWTLEAAERVCAGDPLEDFEILDLLAQLVDKSMVIVDRRPGNQPRYRFLETIRQYGQEKMLAQTGAQDFHDAHLAYFLELAEGAKPHLLGTDQMLWLQTLETDHDNLRAALEWSLDAAVDAQLCLRLAAPMGLFWNLRSRFREGRERLAAALDRPGAQETTLARAEALLWMGNMAYLQSDYDACQAFEEEALDIFRGLGPEGRWGEAHALSGMANTATELGDYETAPRLFKEALDIFRAIGDRRGTADTLRNLGWAAMRPGDYAQAQVYLDEALVNFRELGELVGISSTLSGLGEVAVRMGDFARASPLLEESLALRRELRYRWGEAATLGTLGWMALLQGDGTGVRRYLGESLRIRQELGDKGGMAWCLEKLAEGAAQERETERAIRVFGAAAALRRSLNSVIDPADQPGYERILEGLRTELGEGDFQKAWSAGEGLALEDAVEIALEG